MKELVSEVKEYLKTQRIGVFAIEMVDGSPHAATIHIAYAEDTGEFYIETGAECRKSEPLLKNGSARATIVIGTDENNMKTLQMDGIARVAKESEEDSFLNIYLEKFPSKEGKVKTMKTVCIIFTPTWWRFTDWKTSEGKKIWGSE